jgi:hypothetical protein
VLSIGRGAFAFGIATLPLLVLSFLLLIPGGKAVGMAAGALGVYSVGALVSKRLLGVIKLGYVAFALRLLLAEGTTGENRYGHATQRLDWEAPIRFVRRFSKPKPARVPGSNVSRRQE